MPITKKIIPIRALGEPNDASDPLARNAIDTDFKALAESSVDLIMRVSPDMRAKYVSPSSVALLGWAPEEMVGKHASDFIVPEDLPVIESEVTRIVSGPAEKSTSTLRVRRKRGDVIWMEGHAGVIRAADGETAGDFVVILHDITDRKRLEDELETQALTDGLTGLANRRAFDEALDREWRRTLREGSRMSLLLLDVDRFKEFNDLYGHTAGDACLRSVAIAITGVLQRSGDIVARYGGEEIAVILPGTDLNGAVCIAELLRDAVFDLRLPHAANTDCGRWVSISIGAATALALVGGTIRMPESLLLAADGALYKAKAEGRNRVATALLLAPKGTMLSTDFSAVPGGSGEPCNR